MSEANSLSAKPVSTSSLKTQRLESDLSKSKSSNIAGIKNRSYNRSNTGTSNADNKSIKSDVGSRSETNLIRSNSYVVNRNNFESGIGSNIVDKTSKSAEIKTNKLAKGAKSGSHVPLPKTVVASQKQVTKKNATVGLKESASNNGASKVLPVKQKSSNLSSRHSMTSLNKLAVSKSSVSNNNIPKTIAGGNTGARPKILRNSQRSSSSLRSPTNQSDACIISSLSNATMGAR